MHRHLSDLTCRHLTMILMSLDCSKSEHLRLLAAFQILYLLLSFYAIRPLLYIYVIFLFCFDISALEKVIRLYIGVGNCDSVGTNLILIGEFSPFFLLFSTFQKINEFDCNHLEYNDRFYLIKDHIKISKRS